MRTNNIASPRVNRYAFDNGVDLSNPEQRRQEAQRVRTKYPDRLPVLCVPASSKDPVLDKHKYLVPRDLTVGQFLYVIRKRISMDSTRALFLMCVNGSEVVFPSTNADFASLYDQYQDDDGFLCMKYQLEKTFG